MLVVLLEVADNRRSPVTCVSGQYVYGKMASGWFVMEASAMTKQGALEARQESGEENLGLK